MARKTASKLNAKASASSAARSMTGYGRAVVTDTHGRLSAEIRSVNGRFLKVSVKLPPRYGALEERVRALLAERGVKRGSVDVGLFFDDSGDSATGHQLDAAVLRKYAQQAKAAAKTLGLRDGVSLESLLALPGAVRRQDAEEDLDAVWNRCAKALGQAVEDLDRMRVKEGAAMVCDVQARINELRTHREWLAKEAPNAKVAALEKFRQRIAKMLEDAGVAVEVSRENLERELVLYADRLDISEELARLASHFDQMDAALSGGGEIGKKLDFLTQELFRETNTVGSKAQNEAVTHRVVEMKGLIEKIREQVQNLE